MALMSDIEVPIPLCFSCSRFKGVDSYPFSCEAFDEIPQLILNSDHYHTAPYPGDHGIRFEAVEKSYE